MHLLKRLLQAQKGGLIKAFHTEWNYVVILGSDTPQNRRYFNTPLVKWLWFWCCRILRQLLDKMHCNIWNFAIHMFLSGYYWTHAMVSDPEEIKIAWQLHEIVHQNCHLNCPQNCHKTCPQHCLNCLLFS